MSRFEKFSGKFNDSKKSYVLKMVIFAHFRAFLPIFDPFLGPRATPGVFPEKSFGQNLPLMGINHHAKFQKN